MADIPEKKPNLIDRLLGAVTFTKNQKQPTTQAQNVFTKRKNRYDEIIKNAEK